MEDIDIEAGDTGEQRDSRGRLAKGHAKLPGSGRKPGVGNWNARRVAESMQCSPLIAALTVIKTWHWPLAPGEKPEDRKRCSPELWTRILLETIKLVVPSLSAVQVTGKDEGPVALQSMSLIQIMSDPQLAKAAQTLALGLAQQPQLPGGDSDNSDESGHTFLYEDDPTKRR